MCVIVISTPRNRLSLRDINLSIRQIPIVDMNTQHPPDDDVDGPKRRVPGQTDCLVVLAFEADGGVGDHGDLDGEDGAPGFGEGGFFELVDVVGEGFGGGVDGVPEGVGC